MTQQRPREVEHEITIAAPPEAVYAHVADVRSWPHLFPPTVYVDHLDRAGRQERIRIWALANGEPKTWTSRRRLDPDARRIDFRQEVSAAPVAAMGGAWVIEPVDAERSRVRLLHDYRAVDDDPKALAWIDEAVDRNSRSELAALKANLEDAAELLSFEDTVTAQAPVKELYAFVNDAQLWQERLPHVARVSLREESPGLQVLEMDTRTKDGSTHTTKSVRVCFPDSAIVYKQVGLPSLMTLHTGAWRFEEIDAGVAVTSQHTVKINEANIEQVLGPGKSTSDARQFVRTALSANSRATLQLAKEHAERRG